ncbi:flagellar basal body P-ring protein FlgI [Amaricoccus tamworthensis]|uniref:flagellar basal body P-ring protein FlgI n=1 Tax=Amaricoccus tamworthensis TaxID=57002 RepID=UPI003C7EAB73
MRLNPLPGLLVLIAVTFLSGVTTPAAASPARIKDLVEMDGVRGNDLLGYGLVVGLNNTGDSLRNSPFTEDAIMNLLERLGVNVTGEQIRAQNVAAVLVTATLPPFARAGSQIDVTVSAIGDAESLMGGTLVMTPLNAADGQIYAVAQGSIIAGGVTAGGEAETVTQGVPTAGLIPAGARIEREVEFDFTQMRNIRLALRNPDFTTAARMEAAINQDLGVRIARMLDSGTVELDLGAAGVNEPAQLMAQIENIEVLTSTRARVVVDQRSGTIILGSDVRISRVAVTQGSLTLRVEEAPLVVQPNPFADGETVVIPRTNAEIEEDPGNGLAIVEDSVSLPDVVAGLNALGVSARDMIDILKSIKAAGALHAEFIVQ